MAIEDKIMTYAKYRDYKQAKDEAETLLHDAKNIYETIGLCVKMHSNGDLPDDFIYTIPSIKHTKAPYGYAELTETGLDNDRIPAFASDMRGGNTLCLTAEGRLIFIPSADKERIVMPTAEDINVLTTRFIQFVCSIDNWFTDSFKAGEYPVDMTGKYIICEISDENASEESEDEI